jgi:hypothetical protein
MPNAAEDTLKQRVLRFAAVTAFLVLLGWTIPYMVIVPFSRVITTVQMIRSGYPTLLGQDLSTLVPCAIATYYVLFGNAVRAFWARLPWFAPFVLIAFHTTVASTIMAHVVYLAAAEKVSPPGLIAVAVAVFLAWRLLVVAFHQWRPLETFVVPRVR